jgi:hypothetical protein
MYALRQAKLWEIHIERIGESIIYIKERLEKNDYRHQSEKTYLEMKKRHMYIYLQDAHEKWHYWKQTLVEMEIARCETNDINSLM